MAVTKVNFRKQVFDRFSRTRLPKSKATGYRNKPLAKVIGINLSTVCCIDTRVRRVIGHITHDIQIDQIVSDAKTHIENIF